MQEKFASLQVCQELLDMSHDVEALPELFCTTPAMSRRVQGSGFRVEPFTLDNWWDCVRAAGAYSDQAGSSRSHNVLELGHFSWRLMIMLLM
jgi:hypothetical protein